MSYMVMARKWRPRNFEEMVGQDHIAQTIRNAIEGGRIGHAYLFTGTRGVGKTTSARILAKALNCLNGPTPKPCEVCQNCIAVGAGNSMDVLEIDGASNNSVDNIRELREQVKYAPMQGKYKVYIIDEVHMLSKPAFNALLKTLEEPPPHVVFIFATTESNKVPHTILSRVQRFDFKRISEAHIRGRLEFICKEENIQPELIALETIARKADGSMRDALSLFDQVYAFSGSDLNFAAVQKVLGIPPEELFENMLSGLLTHEPSACFAVIEQYQGLGIENSEFLIGFGEFLRDLLFARQEGSTALQLGLSENRWQKLRSLANELKDGDILRYAKIVSDILSGLRHAVHPRLAVELGFARMAHLDKVVTLSALLAGEKPSSIPSDSSSEVGKKKNLTPLNTLALEPATIPVSNFTTPAVTTASDIMVPIKTVELKTIRPQAEESSSANPAAESEMTLQENTAPPPTEEYTVTIELPEEKLQVRPMPSTVVSTALTKSISNLGIPEAWGSPSMTPEISLQELINREPIIQTLQNLFQARLVD